MPETVIAGRYRLHELLGRSGMSEVWRAEDLDLGRDVAIKLLAPEADTARFEREARAVASLAHPNVMQLYDYGEEDGRQFMVLEYVPGGTLEERLAAARGKPLPDDEAHAIAAGVAAGLAHAHARGVVHRDLKPANVLFDDDGRPKLGDFGIARMVAGEGTLTEAGTVMGTAAYISPEQAAGEPASAASDVYSFGVILFRLLTGRLPFVAETPLQVAAMHRTEQPPAVASLRPDAPPGLAALAAAALAKDPRRRPGDGAALVAAFDGTAETSVLAVPPEDPAPTMVIAPPATPQAPPRSRRRLWIALAAAAAVLLVAAGITAAALLSDNGTGTGSTTPALTTHPPKTTSTTTPSTTTPSTTEA